MSKNQSAYLIAFFLASTMAGSAFAQSANLRLDSREELQRVFGTDQQTGILSNQVEANSVNQAFPSESLEEFRRTFGTDTIEGTVNLQKMATPQTTHSTILLEILANKVDSTRFFTLWHLISLDVTAIDHRASPEASPVSFHEQFGPPRSARALALIHQAMFEASNAFDHKYDTTLPGLVLPSVKGASRNAAITEAAYETLIWLYPGLTETAVRDDENVDICKPKTAFSLRSYYACSLNAAADGDRDSGITIGCCIK